MKELKFGTFANASQYKSDVFKKSVGALTKVNFRGNISVKSVRKIIADCKNGTVRQGTILRPDKK